MNKTILAFIIFLLAFAPFSLAEWNGGAWDDNGTLQSVTDKGATTTNAVGTGALTVTDGRQINTATSGNESSIYHIQLRDGDVAHGVTSVNDTTDTYLGLGITSATNGGGYIRGYSDNAGQTGLTMLGVIGVADPTDTTPAINMLVGHRNGAGSTVTTLAATETVFRLDNYTTPLWNILGNGSFIKGYTTSVTPSIDTTLWTPSIQTHGTSNGGIAHYSWGSDPASSANIFLCKSKSNTIGTYGIVAENDDIGSISAHGDDGTNFETAAKILFEVDGEPATAGDTTDMPGRIKFLTTPNGTAVSVAALVVDSNQDVEPQKNLIFKSETVTCATNAGTAATTVDTSFIVTDGGADTNEDTVALGDGEAGQIHYFVYKTETDAGDSANVTPTNKTFTKIVFDAPGEGCTMVFDGTNWSIVSNNGGSIT